MYKAESPVIGDRELMGTNENSSTIYYLFYLSSV
jgi:hypothetical protein